MAELIPNIRMRFFDSNGDPLSGGKLYSYEAGTTTPLATFTDQGGLTANTNPVILDANGEADVWIGSSGSYKFLLTDSSDVEQWTQDDVNSIANQISTAGALAVNNNLSDLADVGTALVNLGTSSTLLGYLANVTSDLQAQLNSKAPDADLTTLEGRVTTTESDISTNTSAISANTAKVSASGSITTHSDVGGAAPNDGEVLTYVTSNSRYEPAAASGGSSLLSITAKTGAYTATASDDVITCSGAAFTVTLYAASGNTGRKIQIIKTDASLTNIITIDGNGSETIGGDLTKTVNTLDESYTLICTGTGWIVDAHEVPSVPTSYTLVVGASTTAPTIGSGVSVNSAVWTRINNKCMQIQYTINRSGNTGAAAGSGTYLFPLPSGATIDTSDLSVTSTVIAGACGPAGNRIDSLEQTGYVKAFDVNSLAVVVGNESTNPGVVGSSFFAASNPNWSITFSAIIPVAEWDY